jgi:bifunctional DNA-binding transcriptional regulator/antitoxin component of YhaV-PrlF toxin-antitoxin module
VTVQPIAPVIPSHAHAAARPGGRLGPVRQLPLPSVPKILSLPDEVVYGFGRMDVSGRVGDRASVSVLGWRPGDPLTLTAAAGVIIVRRDPAGLVVMPAKPYVAIPAILRRRCGLRPGDRVLLAVFPGLDALAAYSFAVVDQALRAHVPFARSTGGES